jgi:hypothetical protein
VIHSIKHCLGVTVLLGVGESLMGHVLGEEFGKFSSQETDSINVVYKHLDAVAAASLLGEDEWCSIISQAINISLDFNECSFFVLTRQYV